MESNTVENWDDYHEFCTWLKLTQGQIRARGNAPV